MERVLGLTGRMVLNLLYVMSRIALLVTNTLYWSFLAPVKGKGLRWRATVEQFVEYGMHSLPIVTLISFLIGAIIAMQSAYQLHRFGAERYIADLVAVSGMRELGPLMTAILIAGRNGSAITAEIGTMKVAEELDALRVIGLNPIKFLVVPRFLGMALAVPCVTIISVLVLIAGGFSLTVVVLAQEPYQYLERTAEALLAKDFATGMLKSLFFAFAICFVGVYKGFQVEGGAEGVGKQTTSSVVTSITAIIFIDLIFTSLFYFI